MFCMQISNFKIDYKSNMAGYCMRSIVTSWDCHNLHVWKFIPAPLGTMKEKDIYVNNGIINFSETKETLVWINAFGWRFFI